MWFKVGASKHISVYTGHTGWHSCMSVECYIRTNNVLVQAVAPSASVRRYFHTHDIFTPGMTISSRNFHSLYDIFTPHYKLWKKLLLSDIIKLYNVPLQSGTLFVLFMAFFHRFLFIRDCWYNPLTYPPETLSLNSKDHIIHA